MTKKKIEKKTMLIKENVIFYHSVSFKKDGYISLFNAQHLHIELNSKQRCFFDFLCEKMNYKNEILIDGNLSDEFISFLKKITSGKAGISKRSMFDYIEKLIQLRLIIPFKNTALLYVVNPKYVYKGTQKDRIEILNDLLKNHLKYEFDIQSLLNVPISEIEIPDIPQIKFKTYEDGTIEILE
ncbi:MAG: replication/maintenance protein RepL [Flavobacterium sp.]